MAPRTSGSADSVSSNRSRAAAWVFRQSLLDQAEFDRLSTVVMGAHRVSLVSLLKGGDVTSMCSGVKKRLCPWSRNDLDVVEATPRPRSRTRRSRRCDERFG